MLVSISGVAGLPALATGMVISFFLLARNSRNASFPNNISLKLAETIISL